MKLSIVECVEKVRNPLGIIALFITFIYGIASFVIGGNFELFIGSNERLPLIWFIIGFPIIILIAFVFLVVKYNEKLYAPKDFFTQEGFLIANGKTITPGNEPKEMEAEEFIPVRKPLTKTCMIAFAYSTSRQRNEFQSDAALKKYSIDNGLEIKTEVRVTNDYIADGYTRKDGYNCLIEVIVYMDSFSCDTIKNRLKLMCKAARNANIDCFQPVMLLVCNNDSMKSQLEVVKKSLLKIHSKVDVQIYNSQDLA